MKYVTKQDSYTHNIAHNDDSYLCINNMVNSATVYKLILSYRICLPNPISL